MCRACLNWYCIFYSKTGFNRGYWNTTYFIMTSFLYNDIIFTVPYKLLHGVREIVAYIAATVIFNVDHFESMFELRSASQVFDTQSWRETGGRTTNWNIPSVLMSVYTIRMFYINTFILADKKIFKYSYMHPWKTKIQLWNWQESIRYFVDGGTFAWYPSWRVSRFKIMTCIHVSMVGQFDTLKFVLLCF